MVEQKIKRIQDFLINHNLNIETIMSSKLAQLEEVDDAIQKRLNDIENAKKLIKKPPISISSISMYTDLSRKTFYNNELLRLYVEEYPFTHNINKDEEMVALTEYNLLKEKYYILTQEIQDLVNHGVDVEIIKQENYRLKDEIKLQRTLIENLELEYEKKQIELKEIKKKFHA